MFWPSNTTVLPVSVPRLLLSLLLLPGLWSLPGCGGDDVPPAVNPPDKGRWVRPDRGPDFGIPDQRRPDQCIKKKYYRDNDKDGYGLGSAVLVCQRPDGYADKDGDCDDKDKAVNPGAKELCNKKDDNCNKLVDEGLTLKIYYKDGDGDGYGSSTSIKACAQPKGFVTLAGDCNDNNKAINPNAAETCNAIDDNCNGKVDEGVQKKVFYRDQDKDGYGSAASVQACSAPAGFVTLSGDCNDTAQTINPGASEICNNVDDNCNGKIDEGVPKTLFFKDGDGDGYGSLATMQACSQPSGFVRTSGDCNDNNKAINPGASEICNEVDDNCNGSVDEGLTKKFYYRDSDGDGYGSSATVQACSAPLGFVALPGDCNDNNSAIHPGVKEICNNIDDNCNSSVDEGLIKKVYFKDNDGDGFGGFSFAQACSAPAGYVSKAGDCNDFNKTIYPGATEQCNTIDDNCNGVIDDGISTFTVYKDNDGDGYPAKNSVTSKVCTIPTGWARPVDKNGDSKYEWDCDDSDITVYPGAPTKCSDGKDNNCDGVIDRLCFTTCPGQWKTAPFKLQYAYSNVDAPLVDLDGDGLYEVLVQDVYGFAILDNQGNARYKYSKQSYNFSRSRAVVADIDDYNTFSVGNQTLEVLTGNGSRPVFYKMVGKTVTVTSGSDSVYDASKFMVWDLDHDGVVEFFTSSWCEANAGTKVFRYDRAKGTISRVSSIPDPDGVCEYTAGRTLTDLDGDGLSELVFGNGYAQSFQPSRWGGNLHTAKFTDTKTLSTSAYCTAGTCFSSKISGIYGGAAYDLFRVADQIRSRVTYFTSNIKNFTNPATYRYWAHDLKGKAVSGAPSLSSGTLWKGTTDIDNDGIADNHGSYVAYIGLYDVDSDGYPDRIYSSGNKLYVALWSVEKSQFIVSSGSTFAVSAASIRVRSMWDINGDGRLEVISADGRGSVYCHQLGKKTWTKRSSLPPHFPMFARTYQWDNYEPNEGKDENGDGLPDQVVRVPSALTAKGDFYSYLSTQADKDYYLVNTAWGANVCLTAPRGKKYTMKIYSFADRWNNTTKAPTADGKADGYLWQGTSSAGGTVCFDRAKVMPPRHGEYKFVVGIESSGTGHYTPHWPYWLYARK